MTRAEGTGVTRGEPAALARRSRPGERSRGRTALEMVDVDVTSDMRATAWDLDGGGSLVIAEVEGPGSCLLARTGV